MRILVTFALDAEFAPWRRLRRFRRVALAAPSLYEASIGPAEVRVALTGMGAAHARRVVQQALAEGADFCISTGLAGGLRMGQRTGDVLAARAVLAPSGVVFVKSDSPLLGAALQCGAREAQMFRSADSVVMTAVEKARLAVSADAVEMESFAVLSEAQGHRVPAVAIRVIGDTAEQNLPLDFNRVLGREGRVSTSRLFVELARNPLRVPAVARLGRQSQMAAGRLAMFLDRYVGAIALGRVSGQVEAVAG
jgi:nucleoside phosphorylase